MVNSVRTVAAVLAAVFLSGQALQPAWAQAYPVKPVRIIVPAAPGGGVDIMARLLGKEFSASLGQPFVIDNRSPFIPGVEAVAKAPPDGYMLLLTTATYLVNAALHKSLPYDPINGLAPISQIGSTPIIVVAHPSLPVNSLASLATLARKNPASLHYGSGGNGSALHLAGELFKQLAKVDLVHVPYRGTAPAAFDLLAGHIQLMFPTVLSMHPYIKSGKIKVLAILSARRSQLLPDTPTAAQSGYPELVASVWYGFLAPPGTPKHIVDLLHAEAAKAIATRELKERLVADDVEPIASSPADFARFTTAELAKWTRVIRAAKIKIE